MTLLRAQLQARLDGKTKPQGALGRIEALALQVGLVQGTLSPNIERPHVLVFAGDHGAAVEGISAFPREVTAQMVANFLSGGAAINVFARTFGLGFSVVDVGVATLLRAHANLGVNKAVFGTKNYLREPAMHPDVCSAALEAGRDAVAHEVARGTNLFVLGEMGIGNTASAALLMHRLTGVPLEECVGRGTGLNDAALAHKRRVLAQANARVPPTPDAIAALAEFGGTEIAALVGAILEGAARGCVLLIDGFIVSVAALIALKINENARQSIVFSHLSEEKGHIRLLEHMGAKPLLQLGLRLGEGTGAALAYPLVQAAVAMLNEMASFGEAGVSRKAQ